MPVLLPILATVAISCPFFLPSNIVLMLPIISSSFALQWAIDEYHFLSSWLKTPHGRDMSSPSRVPQAIPRPPDDTYNHHLTQWFAAWVPQGGYIGGTAYPLCWSSSAMSLYILRNEPWSLKAWYAAGLALWIIHVPFGNEQFKAFTKLSKGPEGGAGLQELRGWVNMQKWRIWTVDVPGWLCLLVAALKTFGVAAGQ